MSPQLKKIFSDSWSKLATVGEQDRALRNMMVCNYAADGMNAYTVVLREANTEGYELIFYTDHRSPKVEQMKLDRRVTVVMYNDVEKLQLTFKGKALIYYQDELSHRHWLKSGYKGRRSYLAQPAPSTPINEPDDGLAHLQGKDFEDADLTGYENFAVVSVKVNYLEYLQLNREGNRRANFNLVEGSDWQGSWLIP